MTRSSVLTTRFSIPAGSAVVSGSFGAFSGRSTAAAGRGAVRHPAPVRRSAAVSRPLAGRPGTGTVEYGYCGPGVSQVEHEETSRFGFAQMCAVAVTTAVLALGLIGIANLRAEPTVVPAPATTSVVHADPG